MLPVGEGTATGLVRRFELTGGGSARVRFTTAADGDLRTSGPAGPAPDLEQTRSALVDLPWTWLRQVHGPEVVLVERPGDHAGAAADAAVTRTPGAVLAVHSADCGPVALVSPEGVVGAVHAGWRGLAAGVLQATVAQMRAAGAGTITGLLGPCICPGCYEFGQAELDQVAAGLGPEVRGRTRQGRPALDLRAGVGAALAESGVSVQLEVLDVCTSCDPAFFSHRARQDAGRQALLVWMEGTPRQAADPVTEDPGLPPPGNAPGSGRGIPIPNHPAAAPSGVGDVAADAVTTSATHSLSHPSDGSSAASAKGRVEGNTRSAGQAEA